MIKKYVYGEPFNTEAAVVELPAEQGAPAYGEICLDEGFSFTYKMDPEAKVYGLGQNVRGINKKGFKYVSLCTDDPHHLEDRESLYAAHNFIVIDGAQTFGLFIDYPAKLTFDIAYTAKDVLTIDCEKANLNLYVIEGENPQDIVKQFRKLIGRSYIPPKFAFGYGQSRWGYKTREDFANAAKMHREHHIPLDMVYMDIDYMDAYRDFTVNKEEFPDFAGFVAEMKAQNIHLVPIIDAGVKMDPKGVYDVCDEGEEKGYFCKKADGTDFVSAVWPGFTHFPDVLNKEAREWFGNKYSFLLDQGVDGFWNDMNEPSIFYTPEGLAEVMEKAKAYVEGGDPEAFHPVGDAINALPNSEKDYAAMYHNVDGKLVCHKDVHNLFGYNMTRAAGEAFERLRPEERILMFSRSSYAGMHRYGGIWMGDNFSWWSHMQMNLKMLPSLNMMGLLYTGADLGGFGSNATRDLVLRWLALGVFTPLMRNHSALGTRRQEFYQFEDIDDFRDVISVRYRLVPYLYSEYMKAALEDEMMFRPLAFEYPEDKIASEIEDQLLLGDNVMIAPVMTQNVGGRSVYLPEEMMFVKFTKDGGIETEVMEKGYHYIAVALNEVPLFVRAGKAIPVADAAEYVGGVDNATIQMVGFDGAEYALYDDDGVSKDYTNPANVKILKK